MPYCQPPIDKQKRFSTEYQPTKRRGPSVLTPLKRFLEKNITYEDPETKKMVKGKVQEVIALRHILNATTGDHNAITDIIDRVDGKVNGNGKGGVSAIIINVNAKSGLYSEEQAKNIPSVRV